MDMHLAPGIHFSSVYRRSLPGGGYVAIEVARDCESTRTRISVERRTTAGRRVGHQPIILGEADGDESSAGFEVLYRIAIDNAAIARAVLARDGHRLAG